MTNLENGRYLKWKPIKQIKYVERNMRTTRPIEWRNSHDEVVTKLSGKYEFVVTQDNQRSMEENSSLIVLWAFDDRKLKDQQKYMLSSELVMMLLRKSCSIAIGKHVMDTQS
jgi:hypothetical protein